MKSKKCFYDGLSKVGKGWFPLIRIFRANWSLHNKRPVSRNILFKFKVIFSFVKTTFSPLGNSTEWKSELSQKGCYSRVCKLWLVKNLQTSFSAANQIWRWSKMQVQICSNNATHNLVWREKRWAGPGKHYGHTVNDGEEGCWKQS